ncbi:hypothetical protein AB1L13_15945, partial [Brevibacillus sp. 179-C 9.1 HS]|uniref:hypothetical protein n=1 Tax=unclassified Brevibacillus TaxID=2684853 RepID=UPI0039A2F1BD
AASVRPEPGSNSPIKFVTGSKLANHFNDRLINAFAVQFSKSIFCRTFYILSRSLFTSQEVFFIESRFLFSYFVVVLGDKE